jgi:hypothetical protein
VISLSSISQIPFFSKTDHKNIPNFRHFPAETIKVNISGMIPDWSAAIAVEVTNDGLHVIFHLKIRLKNPASAAGSIFSTGSGPVLSPGTPGKIPAAGKSDRRKIAGPAGRSRTAANVFFSYHSRTDKIRRQWPRDHRNAAAIGRTADFIANANKTHIFNLVTIPGEKFSNDFF